MAEQRSPRSFLLPSFIVTDFGIAYTRTLLLDVVEGQYRLISGAVTRTTVIEPDGDVTLGLIRNLEQLQTQTGRSLLNQAGLIRPAQMDGSGFDDFMATASSAGRPLRAVLVGIMDDFSLASARRALTGTYIEAVTTLSLVDIQTEEQRINAILHDQPDVIFLAGGTNEGNEDAVRDLVRLVELAVKLVPQGKRPIVLYGGNESLGEWVKSRFELHSPVFVSDNIRPSLDVESLTSAKVMLARVFDDFLKRQPGGFNDVSSLSSRGIVPTAQSAMRLVRYLDKLRPESGTLYIDVGSGTSTLLSSIDGKVTADIRSTLGLGHHALAALELLDWRDIRRWLPFEFSLDAFEAWAHNKTLAPLSIPQTLHDLFVEQAVTREIVQLMLNQARKNWGDSQLLPMFSPIIVGGAVFTNAPPGQAALMILDALQPVGMVQLWLDPYSLAPALGTVSTNEAVAVVQIVDNGGFVNLGTAFCPTGRIRGTRARMSVKITLPNGEVLEHKLSAGEVWHPQIGPGIKVDVQVRVSRGLRLNGKRRFEGQLYTGTAGLLFDLRGRPLSFPTRRSKQREAFAAWFTALSGLEDILEMVTAEAAADYGAGGYSALDEEDYPTYKNLPDLAPDPAFSALFMTFPSELTDDDIELPDFDFEADFPTFDEDEDTMDLGKELGLR